MFALSWWESALDKLAAIYVALPPPAREQLAGAVGKLNARLRTNPLDEGESRSGGTRVTFVAGLRSRSTWTPASGWCAW